jgi:hypothetical protein
VRAGASPDFTLASEEVLERQAMAEQAQDRVAGHSEQKMSRQKRDLDNQLDPSTSFR